MRLSLPHSICLSEKFERKVRGEHYTTWNMLGRRYTPDVIEHWIRYHWPFIESNSEDYTRRNKDYFEDVLCIRCDLDDAIDKLPPLEKRLILLLRDGYRIQDKENKGITEITGMDQNKVTRTLKKAYRMISGVLEK